MTVLLRLVVLVLLLYFVQSAGVPKPNREESRPEEKRSNQKQGLQGKIQNQSKRTGPNSMKQTRADTRRMAKDVDKSSSKIKKSEKREEKQVQHSKRGGNIKVSSQKKKIDNQKVKKKTVQKKKPPVVKEFQLNDIIFKGRATNEANAFIRGNTKLGKPLELVYEHAREQDLNELEDQIRRRMVRANPR